LDEIRASVVESDLDAVDNLKNSDIPLTTLTDAQKRRKIIEDYKSGKLEPNKKANGSKRKDNDFTRHTNFSELVSLEKLESLKVWTNGKLVRRGKSKIVFNNLI
jgi:hypothetical protein